MINSPSNRCRFTHEIPEYLAVKPKDIKFPSSRDLASSPPFLKQPEGDGCSRNTDLPSVDFSTTCAIFEESGSCKYGFKCRFLGAHVLEGENNTLELVTDADRQARSALTATELNFIDADIRKQLRTKKV